MHHIAVFLPPNQPTVPARPKTRPECAKAVTLSISFKKRQWDILQVLLCVHVHLQCVLGSRYYSASLCNITRKTQEESLSSELESPDADFFDAAFAGCVVVEDVAGECVVHLARKIIHQSAVV